MTNNVTPLRPADPLAAQIADAFEKICDESESRPNRLARAGLLRQAAAGQTAVDRTIARQVARRIPDLSYEPPAAAWEAAAELLDERSRTTGDPTTTPETYTPPPCRYCSNTPRDELPDDPPDNRGPWVRQRCFECGRGWFWSLD